MEKQRAEFEITFHEQNGTVEVRAACDQGESVATLPTAQFADHQLRQMVGQLRQGRLGGDEARQLGARLYDLLLPPRIDRMLNASRATAGSNLTLKVQTAAPAAVGLPWELAYAERRRLFLALDPGLSLVRVWPGGRAEPFPARDRARPLKILVALASPVDYPALNLEEEKAALGEALAGPVDRGEVKVELLEKTTRETLAAALEAEPYHVLHLVSAGTGAALILEGEDGRGQGLSPAQLQALLAGHALQLVVVSSNGSAEMVAGEPDAGGPATALSAGGVPLVLGIQSAITEPAAVYFDRAFYVGIAEGLPVEQALTHARRQTHLAFGGRTDWAAPVLYCNGPLPDPLLFPGARTSSADLGVQQVVSSIDSLVGAKIGDLYYGGTSKLNVQQKIDTVGTGGEVKGIDLSELEGLPQIQPDEPPPAPVVEEVVPGAEPAAPLPPEPEPLAPTIPAGNGLPPSVSVPAIVGQEEVLERQRRLVIAGSQPPRQKIEVLAEIERLAFALEDLALAPATPEAWKEAALLLERVADSSEEAAKGLVELKAQLASRMGG